MKHLPHLSVALSFSLMACSGTSSGDGVPRLEQVWSYPTSQSSYAEVYLVGLNNSTLFGVALDGRIIGTRFLAFDIENKMVKWVAPNPLKASTSSGEWPLAIDGPRSRLIQLNAVTGEIGKTFKYPDTSDGVSRGPLTRGGLTFFQNTYQHFYAIAGLDTPDVDTPRLAWRKDFTSIDRFNANTDGDVFIATSESYLNPRAKLYAFNVQGDALWTLDLTQGKPVELGGDTTQRVLTMAIDGNTLVVMSTSGSLQAYDTQTGQPLWKKWSPRTCPTTGSLRNLLDASLLIAEGTIFFSPFGGTCFDAIDLKTGNDLWQFVSPNRVSFGSKPFYKNGVIYADNSYLWALEAETGKILAVSDKINVGGSGVFYHSQRNELYVWGETLNAYRPLR